MKRPTTRHKTNGDKLKHIPTKKIKEILNDPYTRGIDGKDYEQHRPELERIYFERMDRLQEKLIEEQAA